MPYKKIVPEWNAQGINPPQSLKDAGWQFNQAPPADYFNWFFYNTAQAIIELQLEAINKDQRGATDGVAPLVGGKVPNSYLNIAAPADASTTAKGIVMLDSSTTSEGETKASTPKAVKTVADNLASHAGNTSIHVTAQEKASYAAKETTTGAQAKADAATASAKTYADQQDALLIPLSQKGVASGVATLGPDGKVPSAQLDISAPADATTTAKGIVMLEDSTTSTSVTKAATPKSVKAVADQVSILSDNSVPYGTASGTNAKIVTITNAFTALKAGLALSFKNTTANTGTVTLDVNGLGAKSIVKSGGTALSSGNLKAGGVYTVRYDGTSFILQGEGGSGNAVASDLLSGKTASTDAGDITGTMPNRGTFNLDLGATVPAGYYSGGTVPTGAKYASGTMPFVANQGFSVTGLAFTPNRISLVANGNIPTGGIGSYTAVKSRYMTTTNSVMNSPFNISTNMFSFNNPNESGSSITSWYWEAYQV